MKTFQDFEEVRGKGDADALADFVWNVVQAHESSAECKLARTADSYDRQENETINEFVKVVYTITGKKVRDTTAEPNRIASNFFNRLNTQRVMYSLGNGVSFLQPDEAGDDEVKEALGDHFDHDAKEAAYYACIHGVSFCFWNKDRMHVFKLTEFAPLWDEHTGNLRAGVRYWRLADDKPMTCVLYEEDGYTTYRQADEGGSRLVADGDGKRPYKTTYAYTEAEGTAEIVGEENYGSLPIVPMWASRLKQSTLVGMRGAIDSYDLIRSGFADDLQECSEIYWLVKNAPGMSQEDLVKLRDRMKFFHIVEVDGLDGAAVEPYVNEVPHAARKAYLDLIRDGMYEDFGALDVHAVAAGATNDHIDAAYQPMDENAADFEYWVGEAIRQVLALAGYDDAPVFKRARISNQREQVEMVMLEAPYLDRRTVIRKLPNVTAEEAAAIEDAMDDEDMSRFGIGEDDGEERMADDATEPAPAALSSLNGAQTTSLMNIIAQYTAGSLTEGQAVKLISVSIGVTTAEARNILEGVEA